MAKVICVLYDDPVGGYPPAYAREALPQLVHYPNGQTLPSPKQIDFTPGALLGSVSGALGLRRFLEEQGHTLVVTADKGGRVKGTASMTVGLRALTGAKSSVIAVKTDTFSSEAASTKKLAAILIAADEGLTAYMRENESE